MGHVVRRFKPPGKTHSMEGRWKCVTRNCLICSLVGMDPPMTMALANGCVFIFVSVNRAIFEQVSKQCHHVWLILELRNHRKAASKSSAAECLYKVMSRVFGMKGFHCEPQPTSCF